MRFFPNILWLDCTAAALAGAAVLALSEWLSGLYSLPRGLLVFIGAVNLLYGAYSFSLARQAPRPLALIKLLVVANAAWVFVCLGLLLRFREQVSVFGVLHLAGEALFVGSLAALEWTQRGALSGTRTIAT